MLQPCHRGIYEYLWSEHKYSIIGISIKASQSIATKMGRKPQLLSFLKKLAAWIPEERSEWYNALLNAYMHIKPLISREQRLKIVEQILSDQSAAADSIFVEAIKKSEKALSGCRVFYPVQHAVYKFWDAQDRPGLWVCFGPFQMHLKPEEVFNRVAIQSSTSLSDLRKILEALLHGVSQREFESIPDSLRLELLWNNMVATPGSKAYLHPRINLGMFPEKTFKQETDIFSIAALTLEKLIDNAPEAEKPIGALPDYLEFSNFFKPSLMAHTDWKDDFSTEEAFDFLCNLFWERQCYENGLISAAGVGVQTTDEEVDAEESEHCDNETCD